MPRGHMHAHRGTLVASSPDPNPFGGLQCWININRCFCFFFPIISPEAKPWFPLSSHLSPTLFFTLHHPKSQSLRNPQHLRRKPNWVSPRNPHGLHHFFRNLSPWLPQLPFFSGQIQVFFKNFCFPTILYTPKTTSF